jgi:hypothetical protein
LFISRHCYPTYGLGLPATAAKRFIFIGLPTTTANPLIVTGSPATTAIPFIAIDLLATIIYFSSFASSHCYLLSFVYQPPLLFHLLPWFTSHHC